MVSTHSTPIAPPAHVVDKQQRLQALPSVPKKGGEQNSPGVDDFKVVSRSEDVQLLAGVCVCVCVCVSAVCELETHLYLKTETGKLGRQGYHHVSCILYLPPHLLFCTCSYILCV